MFRIAHTWIISWNPKLQVVARGLAASGNRSSPPTASPKFSYSEQFRGADVPIAWVPAAAIPGKWECHGSEDPTKDTVCVLLNER